MRTTLLKSILDDTSGNKPFALVHRPHVTGPDRLEIFIGKIWHPHSIAAISPMDTTLLLIPYNQLKERGFDHVDDGSQLIAMNITAVETKSMQEILKTLPDLSLELSHGNFDIDDHDYADVVRRIIADEIGQGEGANFVFKREFTAEISDYSIQSALSVFRHLLKNETGAYWNFIIHTGDRTFVGASPELHLHLQNGVATMNPISGTYKYPASGPTLEGMIDFLGTDKETDELYMVVEEELKMIGRFCPLGGKVVGPFLKEMSRVAHTEYFVEGHTVRGPRDILRETLFAPTVTGSPLENACRVIKKYEPQGRGYYSGIGALLGSNYLDSTILIRTADIDQQGQVRIGVGATIVRHSDPMAETEETRAKANALLSAMNIGFSPC